MKKVEKQLQDIRNYIPVQAILETIGSGKRIADPRNVVGQYMYTAEIRYRTGAGRLEVLVHEASGQIRHVLYRSKP